MSTDDTREALIDRLSQTMDVDAWSRADGSPFLPRGAEWADRRSTSREWAGYAVDAGWRPDAPAGATVTREAVEGLRRWTFDDPDADPGDEFVRLADLLAALGMTVTDTPTEGGGR